VPIYTAVFDSELDQTLGALVIHEKLKGEPIPECPTDGKRCSYCLIKISIIRGTNERLFDNFVQGPFFINIVSDKISTGIGVMLDDLIGL
jgi:hypothetical protein